MSKDADEFFHFHTGLKVSLIATPRNEFAFCSMSEDIRDVAARNKDKLDYMLVSQPAGETSKILGIVRLADYFDDPPAMQSVGELFEPLDEEHLIGADASVLTFILSADARPFRLVVSDESVVGLVTLSDLEKLPVRATLFGLITGLEMTMVEAIKSSMPDGRDWAELLSPTRQEAINQRIEAAQAADGRVDDLLFTQFCDKRDILVKALFSGDARKQMERNLKRIEELRNQLAHANEYASGHAKAAGVCQTVRDILHIRGILSARNRDGFRLT